MCISLPKSPLLLNSPLMKRTTHSHKLATSCIVAKKNERILRRAKMKRSEEALACVKPKQGVDLTTHNEIRCASNTSNSFFTT
mmetsp:Transcript_64181/g.71897  ORF Transcript_64181/g.71897 Transcript_64181/m.71897 type:complete len:83 (+) Transcript_64181:2604-2852(+)